MDYVLHVVTMVAIYLVLTASLDLLAGHTGLLSVAHAAFFGIGAYASAILVVQFQLPIWAAAAAGMALGAAVSLMVSVPSLRLRGDYFVIATFAFQMIIFSVFRNWTDVTRGPLGIAGIPRPSLGGLVLHSEGAFAALAVAVAGVTCVAMRQLATSPFGRVLRAIKEEENFARALGKDVLRFKILACAVSAALAALAGSLYAHYIGYIDPSSFTVTESILIITMVIVGGAGTRWGPLVGASVIVVLPELLRFLGLPDGPAANVRQIVYGLLLVAMMMLRPGGLASSKGFGR